MSSREVQEQAHSEWIRRLAETRAAVRFGLFRVESSFVSPSTTTVADSQSPLLELHAATIDYVSQLRPYRREVQELWSEELGEELVPVREGETANPDVPAEHENVRHQGSTLVQPPKEYLSVSLDSIGKWRQRIVEIPDGDGGVQKAKVVLSPRLATAVYEQLGEVIRELNLTAEVEAVAGTDGALGLPDHIKDRAPAYKRMQNGAPE